MAIIESINQGLIAGLISVGKLALIILPLMMLVEAAKQYGWLESFAKRAQWFTNVFYLPGNAALPALIGLFIGIVSGSGVILQAAKEENYSRATLIILFVLVGICHSLLEETAIFIGLGANIFVVAGARLIVALTFAYLIGWLLERQWMKVISK